LLRHAQKDNVVYHGLAGHFLLHGIPHLLKVRILADLEDRVREEMKRENISADEARRVLVKDDEERRQWSLKIFGVDTWDPGLYDLVIHIQCITVDEAVEIIKCALKGHCFQSTPKALRLVDEMALAARLEAALVQDIPGVKVEAKDGEVYIEVKASACADEELMARVKRIASNVVGFNVKVNCRARS
jgi:hypothetical protein